MMIKGSIFAITDIEILNKVKNTREIISITQIKPPYEALVIKHDENDKVKYQESYNTFLSDEPQKTYILNIIKELCLGKDLILAMTYDDAELFFEELNNYFIINFGIYIGSQYTEFKYDSNMDWKICSLLYEADMISLEEFMLNYPKEIYFEKNTLLKLIKDVKPCVTSNKLEDYAQYLYNYKERIRKENKMLYPLFEKVTE